MLTALAANPRSAWLLALSCLRTNVFARLPATVPDRSDRRQRAHVHGVDLSQSDFNCFAHRMSVMNAVVFRVFSEL
jgi:hypothetical protein